MPSQQARVAAPHPSRWRVVVVYETMAEEKGPTTHARPGRGARLGLQIGFGCAEKQMGGRY